MVKPKQVVLITVVVLFVLIALAFGIWMVYVVKHNNNVRNEAMKPNDKNNNSSRNLDNVDVFKRKLNTSRNCGRVVDGTKIINGNDTELFEFPWMALLAYQTGSSIVFMCAGTLITDQFVLTAAHCTEKKDIQLNFVRLGEHNLDTDPDCEVTLLGEQNCAEDVQDIEIDSILAHPEFDLKTFQNDISLIKLARRANLNVDNVGTICLPLSRDLWNNNLRNVTVAGWGLTENGTPSSVLLKATVKMLPNEQCRVYKNINITNRHICIGGSISGSCKGDSGGPLQDLETVNGVKYYQFGVISAGSLVCSANGLPGIHTKLFDYLDWIYDSVGGDLNN